MGTAKIAISLESELLAEVDRLVRTRVFPSRSQAVRSALRDKIERLEHTRLARECAKLDPHEEQAMAEEGLAKDTEQWPEY
ncbi:MAG: ribbon-helix-helix protein, CopG family [Planctomycetes bacterium]|nr:ribbon-helix-helix protein, CopG family [Planctomycetota bacterium]